jgi:SAM-dependent methyltransferase
MRYELFGISPNSGQWRWSQERATQAKKNYEEFQKNTHGLSLDDYYLAKLEDGTDLDFVRLGPKDSVQYYVPPRDYKLASTLWSTVRTRGTVTNYSTEKNEELLTVVNGWLTNENDIIADIFCGSGTTLAVAEKLGRKWIGADLGKFAIHTTRKRMIGVQRELKKEGRDYRAFEVLNLGKYERQHYIGVNPNLRDEEKEKQLAQKEKDFLNLILYAYRADKVEGFRTFHGKKANRLVAVGPINLPVTRLFVEEVILECRSKHITKVDVLAFEFEMGLFPNIQEEAKSKGIDLAMKYIPRDVFDKRAVEKNQVVFHDVSFIEVKPHMKGNSVAVELTDFSVFYNQDSIAHAEASLKNGSNKIVVENGQIIKVIKDKNGIITRETLTKKWTDWIDYWSVDFDFENKKEIIQIKNPDNQIEEVWTGDFVFENEWQSFRTKKNRNLEMISIFKECTTGRKKIAVKVVDIFGNDTMKIIEVTI